MKIFQKLGLFLVIIFALSACSTVKSGGGDAGPVSGSAISTGDGQKSATAGSNELRRCDKNYGRLAIEENPMNPQTMHSFSLMGLSSFSPMPLARHAAMQSGCFTLVDRGASFAMGEKERQITNR